MGRFQCRGIVYSVTGYGNNLSLLAQGVHQPQFLYRAYPGVNGDAPDNPVQFFVGYLFQLGAGSDFGKLLAYPHLLCDCRRCNRIVPGHHHHPYTRPVAGRHRFTGFFTRRVYHPLQPQEGKPFRTSLVYCLGRFITLAHGHGQYPETFASHFVGFLRYLLAVQFLRPFRAYHLVAHLQQPLHRPLDEHQLLAVMTVYSRRVPLPGVERYFIHHRIVPEQFFSPQSCPGTAHQQGYLGRVALGNQVVTLTPQRRLVVQHPGQQGEV